MTSGKPVQYSKHEYIEMGRVLRKQILKEYAVDSCIATVRATLDVLSQVGVQAYALPVRVIAVNEVLFDWALGHDGRYPEMGSDEYPKDGYGIGVGYMDENAPENLSRIAWAGHLVAVADRHWLLDFSLDQASRPEHGINLEDPLVLECNEALLRGNRTTCYQHKDTYIYYTAMPGDDGYKKSPNWSGVTKPTVHVKRPERGPKESISKRLAPFIRR